MELWSMSDQELTRYEVLQRVFDRKMTREQGARVLGLSCRQVYRFPPRPESNERIPLAYYFFRILRSPHLGRDRNLLKGFASLVGADLNRHFQI